MITLYSVCLRRPSASSISRAVSTLNPCCEKYSLIEKQIDSSSSTTSSFRGTGSARRVFALCSRPRKSSLRRPDTVLSFSIDVGLCLLTINARNDDLQETSNIQPPQRLFVWLQLSLREQLRFEPLSQAGSKCYEACSQ